MYKCTNCGYETEKKIMTCKECGIFGSLEEVTNSTGTTGGNKKSQTFEKVLLPEKYNYKENVSRTLKRYEFKSGSLNDFFGGGGLVKGSINFLSAEPGTGKSTFLGQLGNLLLDEQLKILYYSGEENTYQIGDRLKRLYTGKENLIENISIYYGENLEEFLGLIERDKPDIVVLDSIQTIYSNEKEGSKGSLSQQTFCMEKVRSIFKEKELTGFIIGHVTKEGTLAGNKTLEHAVDGVYFLEGQDGRSDSIRILKALKSRYGGSDNVVVMKMKSNGFEIIDSLNAFKVFIEESGNGSGGAFSSIMEGNQLFLLEVQALMSNTQFSFPARVGEGVSKQKLDILIATLIEQSKLTLSKKDIYINVISPFKFKNLNVDLAIIAALLSSFLDFDIKKYIFIGQVDLQGTIRTVPKQEEIINKLIKMGYEKENIISREKYKSIKELIGGVFGKFITNTKK